MTTDRVFPDRGFASRRPRGRGFRPAALGLAAALLVAGAGPAAAVHVRLQINDGPDTGFNDPTPVGPVAGNGARTLGQQRRNVFAAAAREWAARLVSDVEVVVEGSFEPLDCEATRGTLGTGGATRIARDFPGSLRAGTWYSLAQSNALAGEALSPDPAIRVTFNSDVGTPGCLTSLRWDNRIGVVVQTPGAVPLFSVLMHEIAHGLGFFSLVDEETGEEFQGFTDAYSRNLEDHSLGRTWDQMTDSQRVASAIDEGDLHWRGGSVRAKSPLTPQARHGSGHVLMFAPDELDAGSSVSHFDTSVGPPLDELMEPFQTLRDDIILSDALMEDLGWSANHPSASSIEDLNGNGSREIVVLRVAEQPAGHKVVIIDSRSGQVIREIPLPGDVSAVDVEVMEHFGDLPFEEIAVLLRQPRGDRVRVEIYDGGSGLLVKRTDFSRSFPLDLKVVPSFGGTDTDELAVLALGPPGGLRFWVRDGRSGGLLRGLAGPGNQYPTGFDVVPSFGGTSRPEMVAVVDIPVRGEARIIARDLTSGQFLANHALPEDFAPQFATALPSFGGTPAWEMAILGLHLPNSSPRVYVVDAASGEVLSTKNWGERFRPMGIATIADFRHTPAAEILVLGRRELNLRTTVRGFDADSTVDVANVGQADWLSPLSLAVIPHLGGGPADDFVLLALSLRDENLRAFVRDGGGGQVRNFIVR